MKPLAIRAEGLSKCYRIGRHRPGHRTFRETLVDAAAWPARALRRRGRAAPPAQDYWALRDVSFDVHQGDVVAVLGRNGAGKSTLLKLLSRVARPTAGRAEIYGRVGSLLEVGTGFHPELTGRENVYLNGAVLGMRREEIRRRFDAIVEFAEVGDFLDTPVKRYSSGMGVRLAFAVAAHLDPEILIVDEVLAVGDHKFQAKCLGKMEATATGGRTVFFVSHNLATVRRLCQVGIVLCRGRVQFVGPIEEAIASYLQSDGPGADAPGPAGPVVEDEALTIRGVRLASPGGVFDVSEPVEVRFDVEVHAPAPDLRIGFDLLAANGDCVFRTFWEDGKEELEVLPKGVYQVACEIPPHLLKAGGYVVEVIASIHTKRWITKNTHFFPFEAVNVRGHNAVRNDTRPGVVMPLLKWTSEPQGAPTPA
jgi:lipopolysaccharide transport system ATP-binding protein